MQHETEAASVTADEPMFVSVTVFVIGNVALFRIPKEIVAGSTVIVHAIAAPASSCPLPIHSASTGSSESSVVTAWLAIFTISDLICVPGRASPGCICFTSAAAPAVRGVAKLVPSAAQYPFEVKLLDPS